MTSLSVTNDRRQKSRPDSSQETGLRIFELVQADHLFEQTFDSEFSVIGAVGIHMKHKRHAHRSDFCGHTSDFHSL